MDSHSDMTWIIGGVGLLLVVMLMSRGSSGSAQVIPNLTSADVQVIQSNNALTASLAQTSAQRAVALTTANLSYRLGSQQVSAQYALGTQSIEAQRTVALTNLADSYSVALTNAALEGRLIDNQAQALADSFKLQKRWQTFQEWLGMSALQTKQNIAGNAANNARTDMYLQFITGLAKTAASYFGAAAL